MGHQRMMMAKDFAAAAAAVAVMAAVVETVVVASSMTFVATAAANRRHFQRRRPAAATKGEAEMYVAVAAGMKTAVDRLFRLKPVAGRCCCRLRSRRRCYCHYWSAPPLPWLSEAASGTWPRDAWKPAELVPSLLPPIETLVAKSRQLWRHHWHQLTLRHY